MPSEITIPVQPLPINMVETDHPATRNEILAWQRLLTEHDRASNAVDIAGLLLSNLYITFGFATQNNVFLYPIDHLLEQKYFEIQQDFELSKRLIRGVIDHELGIKINGNDIDIVKPPDSTFSGLIIPVVIGIIALSGAIAAAIYQTSVCNEIAKKYREILFRTDKTLCSDPNSTMCKNWQVEKKKSGYEKNMSLVDTITAGVKKIGSGLGIGLLIAIPLLLMFRSK